LNVGLDLASTCGESVDIFRDAKLEITLLTPVWAPRVADFPEFRALILIILGILTKAYKSDSMIHFSRVSEAALAVRLSDHT
jgi:hypothetical protein